MDYGTFKLLQMILFFGSALGFCFWQLAVLRRMRRQRVRVEDPSRRR
jgi:hypothetical protein